MCIVNVLVKDEATGKDQSMTIASSSGLSDKDVEKMVADAEQFAEADNGAFRLHAPVLGMPICRLKVLNKQQRRLAAQTASHFPIFINTM